MASFRYTLPGQIMRMGGCVFSITRVCTDEVWVRSRMSGLFCIKKVSCISRAGWSSGKFSDVNTCQSSSISGPSAIEKPNLLNISHISSFTIEMG